MSPEAPFLLPQILPISPRPKKLPHHQPKQVNNTNVVRKIIIGSDAGSCSNFKSIITIMGCLREISSRVVHHHHHDNRKRVGATEEEAKNADDQLGILAFETAKTMSRLVSLYRSLSNQQLGVLKKEMKSQGVSYLNSDDENYLFALVCAERLEDLDKTTAAVARLSHRCTDYELNRFDLVYTELKLGAVEVGRLDYGSREIQRRVEKMEKLISATSELYSALEVEAEMEICQGKKKQWNGRANSEMYAQKIKYQRKLVRHYKEISLWSKTFDDSVGLMARIVCIIYARIRSVFGPYFPVLPSFPLRKSPDILTVPPDYCLIEPKIKEKVKSRSGPIPSKTEPIPVRFYSQKSVFFLRGEEIFGPSKNDRILHAAGPKTVGGSGLALRYANVILSLEKYLDPSVPMDEDSRITLYQMLPENLKTSVRSKLRKNTRRRGDNSDSSLAAGWRDALSHIMGWLVPMARNTIAWQMDRKFEKMKFDTKPNVLSWQTLHFSDKEKTEAAIAEVLVALSCVCRSHIGMTFGAKEMDTTLLDESETSSLNCLHHIGKLIHVKTKQKSEKLQFSNKVTIAQCYYVLM